MDRKQICLSSFFLHFLSSNFVHVCNHTEKPYTDHTRTETNRTRGRRLHSRLSFKIITPCKGIIFFFFIRQNLRQSFYLKFTKVKF